jgi:hypothetical protein
MGAIRSLTRRCLYLHQGRTLAFGPTGEVVDRYMHDALHQADQATGDLSYFRRGTHPDPAARFTAIRVTRPAAPAGAAEPAEPAGPGAAVARVPVREPFAVEMEIEVLRPLANPNMSLAIKREGGEAIVHLLAREGGLTGEFGRGTHVVRCLLQGLHLLPGRYAVDVGINAQVGVLAWDIVADYPAFEIANIGKGALEYRPERPGHVLCPAAAWTVLDGPRAEG